MVRTIAGRAVLTYLDRKRTDICLAVVGGILVLLEFNLITRLAVSVVEKDAHLAGVIL